MAGTLLLSSISNVALLSDMSNINKKTNQAINTLNRAHLIATYYVLKEDPTNQIKNMEETKMKKIKFANKFSNRTKVFGGMTVLLGIGTIISTVFDKKPSGENEATLPDIINDVVDTAGDAAETISDEVDNIDF